MFVALLLLAVRAALLAQPGPSGLPACSAPDQELAFRAGFVVCYSGSLRVPVWTAHELKVSRNADPPARPRRHFRRDRALKLPGAADADYRHSGYARGHMVPVADLGGEADAVADAFLLSNAVPQHPGLNSGKWRVLESTARRLAASADFAIVFTGPIFCDTAPRIGANQVAVPCELFKVVLARRGAERLTLAAILPNDRNPSEPLAAFLTTVAEVERRTGLAFPLWRPDQADLISVQ